MGLTFFHNYYVVFDPTLLRVGFAESIYNTNNKVSLVFDVETNNTESEKSYLAGTVIVIVSVAIFIAFLILHIKRNEGEMSKEIL